MGQDAATSYDLMPYSGNFIPMTHPDRIATMAVLHGLKPPSVQRCRVLELGCTDGGNLFTMAQSLPDASFLGVDISPVQIAQGNAAADEIGADNVELRALNLTEVDDSFGLFDYIICHGLYSWVTASVRDKIMAICSRNLAPDGMAYVSYNIYPGWHQRTMLREMMLYHIQGITDPSVQVKQARALLDFLVHSAVPDDGPYALYLRAMSKKFEKFPDTYVFHEYLAPENHPIYFHQFVAHAASAGLRYLSHTMFSNEELRLSPEARHVISGLGPSVIRREQYIDFVLNRTFRQSLLCHAGLTPCDSPSPDAIRSLRLVAMARPENPTLDLQSASHEQFLTSYGTRIMVDEPLLKAALFALYQLWPRSAGFEELGTITAELLGQSPMTAPADSTEFATKLLLCHMVQLVNLHTFDPSIATVPGDRACATALARRSAAAGVRVVSLRNHIAVLEEIDRLILPLLDGTRDQAAIVDNLANEVAAGRLKLIADGEPIVEPSEVRNALGSSVKSSLVRMADQALLIGAS
jgi:SAM-dependent methyltransferase